MRKSTNLLTILVLIALVLGALIGQFFLYEQGATPDAVAEKVEPWRIAGDLVFIRPLKLMIIPLVFTSVLTGITSVGDPKKLGLIGGATVLFYVTTMILAVATGVSLAALFTPGSGFPPDQLVDASQPPPIDTPEGGLGSAWVGLLRQMIPDNFLGAAVDAAALSVITATILLGVALVANGEKSRPVIEVVESLHEALMTVIRWVLWLMPLGVVFLVAAAVGQVGFGTLFESLGKYILVVLAGLLIHSLISLPAVLGLLTRINPYRYLWNMRPALITAFSTSSSMATLPVTIETAADSGGCSRRAAGIVLPLGATVNMDGTALYQGIAVIFLFQAYGIDLSFAEYLVIVLTATLSAVGAAGIPGGGIPIMMIIIAAVNTSLAGAGKPTLPESAIALILPVDRILDMCRTSVNVWGDSVGARVISRLAPDIDREKEAAFG